MMGAAEGRLDAFCESAFPAVYDSTSSSNSSGNGTVAAAATEGGLVGSSCATVTPSDTRACCQAKVAQDEADSYCAVTYPEVCGVGWGGHTAGSGGQ